MESRVTVQQQIAETAVASLERTRRRFDTMPGVMAPGAAIRSGA